MVGKSIGLIVLCGCVIVAFDSSSQAAMPAGVYSGPYVGLELGGAVGVTRKNFSEGSTTGDFDVSGISGGADAGYDWTFGKFVVGIEGDIMGGDVSGNANQPNPHYIYDTDNHFIGTLRSRLGYVLGASTLPYVTGGLAVGDVETSSHSIGLGGVDHDVVEPGWDIGAGIETALPWPNWRAKAEYLYVSLADADTPSDLGRPTTTSLSENLFRFGINYAF